MVERATEGVTEEQIQAAERVLEVLASRAKAAPGGFTFRRLTAEEKDTIRAAGGMTANAYNAARSGIEVRIKKPTT